MHKNFNFRALKNFVVEIIAVMFCTWHGFDKNERKFCRSKVWPPL